MGYSLKAVRVPIFLVGGLVGCKDQSAFENHRKRLKAVLEEVDELLEEHSPDDVSSSWTKGVRDADLLPDPELDELQKEIDRIKDKRTKGSDVLPDIEALATQLASFMENSTAEFKKAVPEVKNPQAQVSEDGDLPSAEDVLRHIFYGIDVDQRVGFAYDLILQRMFEKAGSTLKGDNWMDIRSSANLFGEMDKILVSRGISPEVFSVQKHLIDRGNPFFKTHSGDFPFIGYLTLAEIGDILPVLESQKFANRGPEEFESYLYDVTRWLKTCQKNEEDFVCFYS